MDSGLEESLGDRKKLVIGDAEAALARTWVLSDRVLPCGETLTQLYAQRTDLVSREREISQRIAAARLGLLLVTNVEPGRAIELDHLTREQAVSVISHNFSRSVRPGKIILGRVMAGPPAPTVWGPVAFVTRRTGRMRGDILSSRLMELQMLDRADGLELAMHAASREIVQLFPALTNHPTVQHAA